MRHIAICLPAKKGAFSKWFDTASKSAAEKRAVKELTKSKRFARCRLVTQAKPKNNIASRLKWFKTINRKQALKKAGK